MNEPHIGPVLDGALLDPFTIAPLAALGAALCWAVASLFSLGAAEALGGVAFTRIRMTLILLILMVWTAWNGSWSSALALSQTLWIALIVSGLVGIFVGDTALFVTLSRLGPRRTSVLFSTNAPMTALLSWWWFDERASSLAVLGCALVAIGVIVTIMARTPSSAGGPTAARVSEADSGGELAATRQDAGLARWETTRGLPITGIAVGLLAALGQSIGSMLAKPVLAAGVAPIAVTTWRIGVAVVAFWLLRLLLPRWTRARCTLTLALTLRVIVSGLLGMALGMTLLLYAFAHGPVGLSAMLSSTSPALMVPLLWLVSGERPPLGAWVGALLAVMGTGLILVG